jgi:hypothetical protein
MTEAPGVVTTPLLDDIAAFTRRERTRRNWIWADSEIKGMMVVMLVSVVVVAAVAGLSLKDATIGRNTASNTSYDFCCRLSAPKTRNPSRRSVENNSDGMIKRRST